MNLIQIAREVFEIESKEILKVSENIDANFIKAVECILDNNAKTIVCGIGKSGIVGKKISATLSSTGTPSFFLHPSEAFHGDLGMIDEKDIVILISNSGETNEILKILPFLKEQKNTIISFCGSKNSSLVKNSNYFLDIGVNNEACPLQLAPTSSTTSALVMGDALAIALMKSRNFKDENFARLHPGGSLGRKLLFTVKDVMRRDNLPVVSEKDSIKKIIHTITKGKLGLVIVLNENQILGIITDGDVRRAMENREEDFFKIVAEDIMTKNPKKILENEKLLTASKMMTTEKVNSLIVINKEDYLSGIIQLFDIGF